MRRYFLNFLVFLLLLTAGFSVSQVTGLQNNTFWKTWVNVSWTAISNENITNYLIWRNTTNVANHSELQYPNASVVGLWHFNNGSGTHAVDNSSYGNNGTLYNGTLVCSGGVCPSWNSTNAKFGTALTFDGIRDYVLIPDSPSLSMTMSRTIEAWVKFNSLPSINGVYSYIVSKDAASPRDWYLAVENTANKLILYMNDGSNAFYKIGTATTFTTGVWYYVVGVYNTTSMTLYINGAEEAGTTTGTVQSSTADTANAVYIGERFELGGDANYKFNGTIDEVAVWNVSLSAAEILSHYNAGQAWHNDTGLAQNTQYAYVIGAQDSNGAFGANSSALTWFSPPQQVTGLASASNGTTWVNITWSVANVDITNYLIYRANATSAFYNIANHSELVNPNASVVGLWHFNNGSGTHAIDNSSYMNNGTIYGAVWNSSGKFGNGLTFDGVDDNVTISDSNSLDITGSITIEAWIYPYSIQTAIEYIAKLYNYDFGIYLNNLTFGYYMLDGSNEVYVTTTPASSITPNSWNHIAVTFTYGTGSSIKLYLNGVVLTGSWILGNGGVIPNLLSNQLRIPYMNSYFGANYFNGSIDEVAIWNVSLSAAEILSHYNAGQTWHNNTGLTAGINYRYMAGAQDSGGVFGPNSSVLNVNIGQNWTQTFGTLFYSPNTTDDVDPGTLMNFTVNVSSIAGSGNSVNMTILQYKRSTSGTWLNATMSNTTPQIFNFSFLNFSASGGGNIDDTWNVRVWANNTNGESNASAATNIAANLDGSWSLLPETASISALSSTDASTLMTINNTGDYALEYNFRSVASGSSTTNYNVSLPFSLATKGVKYVNVTVTVPADEGESTVKINVSSTTSQASPALNWTNITVISYKSGPYIRTTISSAPSSMYQGTSNRTFAAYVENKGNDNATNVTITWNFPAAGWTPNATTLVANISIDQKAWHNITVATSALANASTANITLNVTYNNVTGAVANTVFGAQRNSSASILILCNGTDGTCGTGCTYVDDLDCFSVSGGSGVIDAAEGGGGGAAPAKYISAPFYIEGTIGKAKEFYITVRNTEKETTFENLSVSVNGYLSQYVQVVPVNATSVPYGSTGYFKIMLTIPSYMEEKSYNISYSISGNILRSGNQFSVLSEKNSLLFYVSEFGKDDGNATLSSIREQVDNMSIRGLPTAKIRQLLEKARKALADGRNSDVKRYSEEIVKQIDAAYATQALLKEVEGKLSSAKAAGLDVTRTEDLYNLAKAAFDREAFDLAKEHLGNALSLYAIETKSEFNIFAFAVNYWWLIISAAAASIIGIYLARRTAYIQNLDERLAALADEEVKLNNLLGETQADFFKRGALSETDYHKAMYLYRSRLTHIKEEITTIRAKKAGIISTAKELDTLKEEGKKLNELVRQAQDEYFNRQSIGWNVFQERMAEFRLRRIGLEESIAVLEAKFALEREKKAAKKKK